MSRAVVLRDWLAPALPLVFCGVNPGLQAAADDRPFAGRGNRFWAVLHEAGFTLERFGPDDADRLLGLGVGITAFVRRPTAGVDALSTAELSAAAPAFLARMRALAPRRIAFLGKASVVAITGRRAVPWGLQPEPIAGAQAWVLPNPSGRNRGYSMIDLVSAYRVLRTSIDAEH